MLQQLTFFLHRLYVCEEDFEEEKKKVKLVFSIGLHSVSAIEMMCSCPPRTHRLALIKTTKNIIWPTVKRHIRYDSQSKYVWRFIWQAWMLNAVHDFGTRGKTKQLHVTLFKTPLRESRAVFIKSWSKLWSCTSDYGELISLLFSVIQVEPELSFHSFLTLSVQLKTAWRKMCVNLPTGTFLAGFQWKQRKL